jgi:hypothetical protein
MEIEPTILGLIKIPIIKLMQRVFSLLNIFLSKSRYFDYLLLSKRLSKAVPFQKIALHTYGIMLEIA